MVEKLTYEEKVESILSMLATPIYRRRINDDGINKLITETYLEMKERKRLSVSEESISTESKAQELIDNIMMNYVTNPEECYPDYDLDEMPDEYDYVDIIN